MSAQPPPSPGHVSDWDPGELDSVPGRMEQMKELRSRCPVAYTSRGSGYWTVLKHADVQTIALDMLTFGNGGSPRHGVRLAPLEVDPPEHRDYRSLLNPFFMPKRVQALEPQVRLIIDRLLQPLLAAGKGDLAKDFSYPFPVLTLCALLDLQGNLWPHIKRLSEQSLLVESPDAVLKEEGRAAHLELLTYARQLVKDRLDKPRAPDSDMIAALLNGKVAGQPIDEETVAGVIRLLISAGHNSTTSGLGNALLYLAEHPDDQERLRQNPGQIPLAIEELLRYETPVQSMPRYVTKDTVLGGRALHSGERVDLMFGSANRDEAVFENADQCVLSRKPNRHIAFGHGIHSCLGAPVARMEMRVALEELLRRTKSFQATGPALRPPYHRLGVESLPVTFTT
jgi:cytochrome P450